MTLKTKSMPLHSFGLYEAQGRPLLLGDSFVLCSVCLGATHKYVAGGIMGGSITSGPVSHRLGNERLLEGCPMSFLGNPDHAHALQDLIAAHHNGGYIIHVGDIQQFDEKHTRVISHIGDDPADHDMVFWEKDIPGDSIVVATQPTYRDDFPTTYVGTHDQTESAIAACMSIKDIKEGRRWLIRQATNTYNSLEQRADYARTIISTDNILKLRTPKKITALAQPVGQ